MTNAHNLNARQIAALQVEAARAGDWAQVAICERANGMNRYDIGGRYPAMPRIESARAGLMDIDTARAECAAVIAEAAAR